MLRYSLKDFDFNKEYSTLRSNTRKLQSAAPAETIAIVGERETKMFNYTGGDEGYDPIYGECLVHHYRSECGRFFAYIEIVT